MLSQSHFSSSHLAFLHHQSLKVRVICDYICFPNACICHPFWSLSDFMMFCSSGAHICPFLKFSYDLLVSQKCFYLWIHAHKWDEGEGASTALKMISLLRFTLLGWRVTEPLERNSFRGGFWGSHSKPPSGQRHKVHYLLWALTAGNSKSLAVNCMQLKKPDQKD